jgi:hypothetical protein
MNADVDPTNDLTQGPPDTGHPASPPGRDESSPRVTGTSTTTAEPAPAGSPEGSPPAPAPALPPANLPRRPLTPIEVIVGLLAILA